jgi:hypothetical protein
MLISFLAERFPNAIRGKVVFKRTTFPFAMEINHATASYQ